MIITAMALNTYGQGYVKQALDLQYIVLEQQSIFDAASRAIMSQAW